MDIRTEIDRKYGAVELHVCSGAMTDEVRTVERELHEMYDRRIPGTDARGNRCLLTPGGIISVYAEGQKVMALCEEGTYTVPAKLYEFEQAFGEHLFVRISKSELVNIRKIRKLDMSISGTIRIRMKNGYETYVSRRNVAKIRERLLTERPVKNG
ncbi:MAG: LytTR family transcriptional regulator [Lachnospiraceae bacterium]|nr:LytTR family transcriptional regulator [Lachnospiraceae bacterium]